MPYANIGELPQAVRDALPEHAQRIYLEVFNSAYGSDCDDACASAQAWAAVKRTYHESTSGEWVKNLVELHGIGNAIDGTHDVVLQRLDTLIKNNGEMIHYAPEAFANTADWVGIPVIYAEIAPLAHPSPASVLANTLGDGYSVAGKVTSAAIGSGEPILRAQLAITDSKLDALASSGALSLSTGFSAEISNVSGQMTIVSPVVPNHVLIFKRGACRNCYPNDNSARFENAKTGDDMAEEDIKKGFVEALREFFGNSAPKIAVPDTKVTEQFENVAKENTELKKQLADFKNAQELERKERDWAEMKNVLPAGWLGAKEAETRREFEESPVSFSVKFAKFTAENVSGSQAAEGSEIAKKPLDAENAIKAELGKFEQEYGLKFV